MKLLIPIVTILFLSGCSQSQLSKKDQVNCNSRSEKQNIQEVLTLLQDSIDIEQNLMQRLVMDSDVPELLVDIVQIGLTEGITFEKIKPKKESIRVNGIEFKNISIMAEGNLDSIAAFLKNLGRLPHMLKVSLLNISRTNTEVYGLNLTLDTPLNDLNATNADIGLVPLSTCAELFKESFEKVTSLSKYYEKHVDNYYLFGGLNKLFSKVELENLISNPLEPQILTLNGRYLGNQNIKYIIDIIEGFPLHHHSIEAIEVDKKEQSNDFSIVITLKNKKDIHY